MQLRKRAPVVVESNAIARAKIDPAVVSVWEERIIALIASQNTTEDKFFKEHVIPITEITGGKALSTLQFEEAKKAVKERLVRQTYVMPMGKKGFKAFPIFVYIAMDDSGNIKAKLNEELCGHFLELKKEFAVRSLPAFSSLTSTYAQQLFRYLNSWKALGEATISLIELHNILSTPSAYRKDFKAFRIRVLETAKKEITNPDKTNFFFDWEPVKEGLQKVVAIRFTFVPALVESLAKVQETVEQKTMRERGEAQQEAEECWQMWRSVNKKCRPGKRAKKCQYCTTAGRWWAEKCIADNQLAIPGFKE